VAVAQSVQFVRGQRATEFVCLFVCFYVLIGKVKQFTYLKSPEAGGGQELREFYSLESYFISKDSRLIKL
jgi:hypothetical protein